MIYADIHEKEESRIVIWADKAKESVILEKITDSLPYCIEYEGKFILSIYDFVLLKEGLKKHLLSDRKMTERLHKKISLLNSLGPELGELDLKRNLLPFQVDAVRFLSSRNALLADQMGLGKTTSSLVAADLLIKQGKVKHCVLLVTKSALEHWCDQIKIIFKEEDVDFIVISGKKQKERLSLYKENHKFYIVTLDTFKIDVKKLLPERNKQLKEVWNNSVVIIDEVHRIKNPKTGSAKATYKIGKYAKYRWGLSGSPLDGKVEKLYGVMNFIDKDFFVNKNSCLAYHAIHDYYGSIVDYKNMDKLKQKLKTIMFRRLKKEVWTELPEKVYLEHYIDLSVKERKFYNQVKKQELDMASEEVNKKINDCLPIGLVSYGQMCADAITLIEESWTEPSSKMKELYDLLEEITLVSKVVVFTKYAKMCHLLHKWLPWKNIIYTGELSGKERRKRQIEFLTDSDTNIFIMDTAGAQSIDLHGVEIDGKWHQGAEYLIRYDSLWNPAMNEQVEDRIHRIGQKGAVTIIDLIIRNTLEEKIRKMITKKKEVIEKVIEEKITREECTMIM